jgi:hypothetical protein
MRFRFGTSREYGGVMRSKMSRYPLAKLNMSHAEFGLQDVVYGDLECSEKTYALSTTGFCPSDRTPSSPPHADEHSFSSSIPGLIEWSTFGTAAISKEPAVYCPDAGANCDTLDSGLRSGLYNFVVMVEDLVPPELEVR